MYIHTHTHTHTYMYAHANTMSSALQTHISIWFNNLLSEEVPLL